MQTGFMGTTATSHFKYRSSAIYQYTVSWWRAVGGANLLLAGPAVAVGESVVLPLTLLLRLNDSVLLELNQAAFRVPRLQAAKQDNETKNEDAVET